MVGTAFCEDHSAPKEAEVTATQDQKEIASFIRANCTDCHNEKKQKGKTNLNPFLNDDSSVEQNLLLSVYDQINLGEMPPDDKPQPQQVEREEVLASLERVIRASGAVTVDKSALPGYGNYVDHKALFELEHTGPRVAPRPRLWRYSPETFSERVNRIAGHDVIKFVPVATFPVPQKGLKHPAFPYRGPAHTARDFANIHDFGLTTTELLIGVAEELAEAQLTSGSLKEHRHLAPDSPEWSALLDGQFEKLYHRKATDDEKEELRALQRKVAMNSSSEMANRTMITATYLRPESLFRFEVGEGSAAAEGRTKLSSREYTLAVGLALNRLGPTSELVAQLQDYGTKSKESLKAILQPFLQTEEAHQRIMRFMDEYFEYGYAAEVFKDKHHRRYRPGWIMEDAEKFVSRIVKNDVDVLKDLLTSNQFSVRGAFNTKAAPKWFQDETNGHLFYHEVYNLTKDDLGKDPEWREFSNQRAGILTHPAWLISFSDNTKNHAIQRGRWIQTKLLGGVIPDTPVEVDARLPDDPKLTLREKMKVLRKEECWKCHQRMDPLGLPFEQYDLWGRHRTKELDRPADTTGSLHGQSVQDPLALVHQLAASERVHQVFLRHVFRYFCGRNETLGDAKTLREMAAQCQKHNGSLKEAILELLVSDSFIERQAASGNE